MIFKNKHSNKPDLNLKILIDNSEITKVHTTKFLGLLIDDNLAWKSHTTHVSKIISKYNGIIRKIRHFLPQDSLHTLYETLILPYLNYCTLIWADNNNSHLDNIFLLQKKVIRTCTFSPWLAHTDPLFRSLNTLKIYDIYFFQLVTFMFKYHHNLLPPDILDNDFFITNQSVHDHYTRQINNIHVASTNTLLAENTIKIQGALVWNNLHTSLKISPSLGIFKHTMKQHLVNQYPINPT